MQKKFKTSAEIALQNSIKSEKKRHTEQEHRNSWRLLEASCFQKHPCLTIAKYLCFVLLFFLLKLGSEDRREGKVQKNEWENAGKLSKGVFGKKWVFLGKSVGHENRGTECWLFIKFFSFMETTKQRWFTPRPFFFKTIL